MPAFFTPTLEQAIRRARNVHGCRLEAIAIGDAISGMSVDPVQILTREVDGEELEAVLPTIQPHERIVPEKLREICADLRLPADALYPEDPWADP